MNETEKPKKLIKKKASFVLDASEKDEEEKKEDVFDEFLESQNNYYFYDCG